MIFITGGVRSGKSTFGEALAKKNNQNVLYIATAYISDVEMQKRVDKHKATRPSNWITHEGHQNLQDVVLNKGNNVDFILFECITTYITNLLFDFTKGNFDCFDEDLASKYIYEECQRLIHSLLNVKAKSAVITNEVGYSIVPDNPLSRYFRDLQGFVNQSFAKSADEAYIIVSGIPMKIK